MDYSDNTAPIRQSCTLIPCPKCNTLVTENTRCPCCGTLVGQPKKPIVKYCPYCGKRLEE